MPFTEKVGLSTRYGELDLRYYKKDGKRCLVLTKTPWSTLPLVRIQSACIFGEAFESVECDCAKQLQAFLAEIANKGGVLVYLFQEGRGAGLEVKIAAMALSKTERISSTEAFRLLGIPIDSRDYSLAVEAMRELGVPTRIAAVTANMGKVKALKNAGFQVVKLIQNAENLSQHHQKMTWSRRCRYRQRVQPFCDV